MLILHIDSDVECYSTDMLIILYKWYIKCICMKIHFFLKMCADVSDALTTRMLLYQLERVSVAPANRVRALFRLSQEAQYFDVYIPHERSSGEVSVISSAHTRTHSHCIFQHISQSDSHICTPSFLTRDPSIEDMATSLGAQVQGGPAPASPLQRGIVKMVGAYGCNSSLFI